MVDTVTYDRFGGRKSFLLVQLAKSINVCVIISLSMT